MATAAALRLQIEHALESRFPAALTPAPRTYREVAETGIPAIDTLLEGGLPVGAISELVGPECSGRTSLALAFLARRTAEGKVCAWIDAADAFDPESAAASSVNLKQLLWVRCRDGGSNAPISRWKREEKPWTRLDQALRVADLLLQAGGFAALVLDLGGMPPAHGMKIPLTSWFRFRQAADSSRCSLVVLSRASYAQSSAALVVDCALVSALSQGATVLSASSFQFSQRRQRFAPQLASVRKPPASTWTAPAAWAAERSA
jgi:hypothetical protein